MRWMKRTAHRVWRRRTQRRFRVELKGRKYAVLEHWYEMVLDERPILTEWDIS